MKVASRIMLRIELNTTALVSQVAPHTRFMPVTYLVSSNKKASPKKNVSRSIRPLRIMPARMLRDTRNTPATASSAKIAISEK